MGAHESARAFHRAACLVELRVRLLQLVDREEGPARAAGAAPPDVEAVGVAGGRAHHPWSAAADPDRRVRSLCRLWGADRVHDAVVLAAERRSLLRPKARADLERLAELRHSITSPRELVAVGAVLVLLPSRTDAELDPAVRHLIDAGDGLREQRRVAVLRRRDETAEPDRRRVARERGKQRPRLEAVAIGEALAAEEVIAHPERLETGALRLARELAQLRVLPSRGRRDDRPDLHAPDDT